MTRTPSVAIDPCGRADSILGGVLGGVSRDEPQSLSPGCPGQKPHPSENGRGMDVHSAPITKSDRLYRDPFAALVIQSISVR